MRLSQFWGRMDEAFGPVAARALAHDHVFPSLRNRTVEQALAAGEDARDVWRVVHSDMRLPPQLR